MNTTGLFSSHVDAQLGVGFDDLEGLSIREQREIITFKAHEMHRAKRLKNRFQHKTIGDSQRQSSMSVRQHYQSLEAPTLDVATPEKMHKTGISYHTKATQDTKDRTDGRGAESIYTIPTPHQMYGDTNDSQEQPLA